MESYQISSRITRSQMTDAQYKEYAITLKNLVDIKVLGKFLFISEFEWARNTVTA